MTRTIRVPDPVYERANRQADREDVAVGAVVRDWMDKAEHFDNLPESMKTGVMQMGEHYER